MKPGHRYCYMSREFAQQHAFIPKDAAPGLYGYSGITNLGNWPIKVGEKTVEQQVMLVESSYFPIILGRSSSFPRLALFFWLVGKAEPVSGSRSFMEKRDVKTDPLDQTSVQFLDTGEIIPTDVVVVKVGGPFFSLPALCSRDLITVFLLAINRTRREIH
jgi:hypothetical protein